MLRDRSTPVQEQVAISGSDFSLSIAVDRAALSPCVIAAPLDLAASRARFPFSYSTPSFNSRSEIVAKVASHLQLSPHAHESLAGLLQTLWQLFKDKDAILLDVRVGREMLDNRLVVHSARFDFDDAALRIPGRHADISRLRNRDEEIPEEVEAEKDGIVYVKSVPACLVTLLFAFSLWPGSCICSTANIRITVPGSPE